MGALVGVGDRDRLLAEYRAEVIRWNGHINLVSRRDTSDRVADLTDQCLQAVGLILGFGWPAGEGEVLHYFDLGSGGGFPGVIWHLALAGVIPDLRTRLVEPRSKRAWFLERVGQLAGMPAMAVHRGRWGQVPGPEGESGKRNPSCSGPRVLISLKALRLNDMDVLAGLSAALGCSANPAGRPAWIGIARFHPPDGKISSALAGDLGIPAAGTGAPGYFPGLVQAGGRILGPTAGNLPASLVLSEYTQA